MGNDYCDQTKKQVESFDSFMVCIIFAWMVANTYSTTLFKTCPVWVNRLWAVGYILDFIFLEEIPNFDFEILFANRFVSSAIDVYSVDFAYVV